MLENVTITIFIEQINKNKRGNVISITFYMLLRERDYSIAAAVCGSGRLGG